MPPSISFGGAASSTALVEGVSSGGNGGANVITIPTPPPVAIGTVIPVAPARQNSRPGSWGWFEEGIDRAGWWMRQRASDLEESIAESEGSALEKKIPIWGSYRAAIHHMAKGDNEKGMMHLGLTILDVFTVGQSSGIAQTVKDGVRTTRAIAGALEALQKALDENDPKKTAAAIGQILDQIDPCDLPDELGDALRLWHLAKAADKVIDTTKAIRKLDWTAAEAHAMETIRELMIALGSCFVEGTPLLTPTGSKTVETFVAGDAILSRSESNAAGELCVKTVERVFQRTGRVLELVIGGQMIRTTVEHPFWVVGEGWLPASRLKEGARLARRPG